MRSFPVCMYSWQGLMAIVAAAILNGSVPGSRRQLRSLRQVFDFPIDGALAYSVPVSVLTRSSFGN